jgi:TatD DNase family protein
MNYEYFDIHSHLNFKEYDKDRNEIIAELQKQKIATITVGVGHRTSEEAVALAEKHPHIFASVGLHPDHTGEQYDEAKFEALLMHPKVVAVGECGLDYVRLPENAEDKIHIQKENFEKQIELAVHHKKPLMIHCREAFPDALAILESKKQEHGDNLRGNFHFFSAPMSLVKRCLDLDFYVSFTGPITFVQEYVELVKLVPIERIMTETDAPYAAPVPHRGHRNNPLYIPEIVKKITEIKHLSPETAKRALVDNALQLFFNKN